MTLAEIAPLLHPPVSAEQLMRVIMQLPLLQPVGTRATGRPGPPWLTWDVDEVMDLHTALARWLPVPGRVLGRRPEDPARGPLCTLTRSRTAAAVG